MRNIRVPMSMRPSAAVTADAVRHNPGVKKGMSEKEVELSAAQSPVQASVIRSLSHPGG